VVITALTRNQVALHRARGFESHLLRQDVNTLLIQWYSQKLIGFASEGIVKEKS